MGLPWHVPSKDLHVQVEVTATVSAEELFDDEELVEWFEVRMGVENQRQMLWHLSLAILKKDEPTLKAFAKRFAFDVNTEDLANYKPETLLELLGQWETKTFAGDE